MRDITPAQLKIIHVLIRDLGIVEHKPELVFSFTDGRTQSSREMTLSEAKSLIEYLKGRDKANGYIKRIWHLAYEVGMIQNGDMSEKAMNAAKLDSFCLQMGSVKKKLTSQSVKELAKTVKQFEAIYQKHKKKQDDIRHLSILSKVLGEMIQSEDYEGAAIIKQEIDKVNQRLTPKRKRTFKVTA